jgi:hypothetical protein
MTDDTKWHKRLILPVCLDGDCIPLNSSTRITTAEANGNESTAISADRFLYTKAPRLYSEMYIQVHNVSNRDVKDDRACSSLPADRYNYRSSIWNIVWNMNIPMSLSTQHDWIA